MIKNKIAPLIIIFASLLSLTLQATDSDAAKEPEFVLAVFATNRTRADLLEKAERLNIRAYNINWESQIDTENNCINKAWTRVNGQWKRADRVPLPDVVYDFGVYKKAKFRKEKANALKEQLRERDIPFINPEDAMDAVNDKMLFSKIMRAQKLQHPQTLRYSKWNLRRMLWKHDLLYVKPTLGSKGYGIIVVEKIAGTRPSRFRLKYKIRYRGQWALVQSEPLRRGEVSASIAHAKEYIGIPNAPYLIQQGINSFRYQGKQTDFRLNMQRGQNGQLENTGFAMRVGGNISQGGRPADYRSVLKPMEDIHGVQIETIKNRVIEVAMKTHAALEKSAKRKIGDLGMDLVIDEEGNPYIIEANNKNGYFTRHVKANLEAEKLYDLPPFLEQGEKIDADHEDNLIAYARHLVATNGEKQK